MTKQWLIARNRSVSQSNKVKRLCATLSTQSNSKKLRVTLCKNS
jgi:hypothetical protein